MPNLQQVIKVTQAQYDILASGGTVGDYTGLDSNYLYLIQDNNEYATEDYVDDAIADLATVARTGSYTDLSNKPTIPTVNDGKLSIQGNGTTASEFTANSFSNVTLNIKGSGATTVSKTADNEITVSSSHQSIKTLKTDNTSAQSTSSSEAIVGSGTINLHKISKTGDFPDLNNRTSNFIDEPDNQYNKSTITFRPYISDTLGNRLYGLKASRIVVEESIDAGATWSYRTLTDQEKNQLFDNSNSGGQLFPKVNGNMTCSAMLRITCALGNFGTTADEAADSEKIALWNSTNYVSGPIYCNCDRFYVYVGGVNFTDCWMQTAPAPASGSDPVWTDKLDITLARGWNGGNVASTTNDFVLGGQATQAPLVRFIFRVNCSDGTYDDSKLTNITNNLRIMNIRAFGNTIWSSSTDTSSMLTFNTPYRNWNGSPTTFSWYGDLVPSLSNTYDLGFNSVKWRNVQAMTYYEDGTRLADKYLGKTAKAADSDKLDGKDSTDFYTKDASIIPTANGTLDIGSSSYKFKRAYINEGLYLGSARLQSYSYGVTVNTNFAPTDSAAYDLGASAHLFRDLYLSRNLTDGTNTVAISEIQKKVEIKRFI